MDMPRLITAVALAALAASARAQSAPEDPLFDPMFGIVGDDDRVAVESNRWPWTAIGRIDKPDGYCTGTLVGPRHVLTAAHCLYIAGAGQWVVADKLRFLAGYARGESVAHARAVGYVVGDGYDPRRPTEGATLLNDWAVVELERPLDVAAAPIWPMAPVAMVDALADGRLMRAGYSRDRPDMLSVDADCGLAGIAGGTPMLLHACDAIDGDSGSALLMQLGRTVGVVALHVATLDGADAENGALGLAVPADMFVDAVLAAVGPDAP